MACEDLSTSIEIFSHEMEEVIDIDQHLTILIYFLFRTFIGQLAISFVQFGKKLYHSVQFFSSRIVQLVDTFQGDSNCLMCR